MTSLEVEQRLSNLMRKLLMRKIERICLLANCSPVLTSKSIWDCVKSVTLSDCYSSCWSSLRRNSSGRSWRRANFKRSIDWLHDFRDRHTRIVVLLLRDVCVCVCVCSLYNIHAVSVFVPSYVPLIVINLSVYQSRTLAYLLALCRYEIKI